MVYLQAGVSRFSKGNISRVDIVTGDDVEVKVKVVKGVPQTFIQNKETVGRPRIVPYFGEDNIELKQNLGLSIKGMSQEQRRAYNRLAKRKEYAKQKVREEEGGMTASEYKRFLNKKIKDFSKDELREYYRLNKAESRIEN
tara:strand:+ start:1769 stop:2191 length:423 start_codon:yes stop_codon:yes gene_type:complete